MKKLTLTLSILAAAFSLWARTVNVVSDFNAVPDGKTVCTKQIQAAIDECAKSGGGKVIIPEGVFKTSTLYLKSNITLHLERNSVILGVEGRDNYPVVGHGILASQKFYKALIMCDKVENVAIEGMGEINGNGLSFLEKDNTEGRPIALFMRDSKNMKVSGITLKNSAFWSFRMQSCDTVKVDGIKIYSHVNFNNDGFDIESKNVVISNCIVDTDDDALCFKSEDEEFMIENITVTNCILASNCNFIKFGTGSVKGFRNIAISNIVMKGASEDNLRQWAVNPKKYASYQKRIGELGSKRMGIDGIALEAVDGAIMDGVAISNIVMTDVKTPILIRVGHRNTDARKSAIRNITIGNVIANSVSPVPCIIASVPEHELSNVAISDCFFNMYGSAPVEKAFQKVPERINGYPASEMFGMAMPAYGMYIRHADNITLNNVQFAVRGKPDFRHAIFADDTNRLRLLNCVFEKPEGKLATINLVGCQNYKIENCEQFPQKVAAKK